MLFDELDVPELDSVYSRFIALAKMCAEPCGCLLLYSGLDRYGIAVTMAANVAGAASLGVEPDSSRAKLALRAGVCDFVVNNLNEALRILKNEIRNRRSVSIALTADVAPAVAEMVARGVQPEILTFPVQEMMARGTRVLAKENGNGMIPIKWEVGREPLRWLPVLDEMAIASLRVADMRVRWLRAAPRYLGRGFAGKRYLQMTNAEMDKFTTAIRKAVTTEAIPVEVFVTHGD